MCHLLFSTTSALLHALCAGLNPFRTTSSELLGKKVGGIFKRGITRVIPPRALRGAPKTQKIAKKNRAAPKKPPCYPPALSRNLNRCSATEEVEQNGNNRENQQNVNESAGHVECREAQKPQNQKNSGDNR
jgi:hypothetical protein